MSDVIETAGSRERFSRAVYTVKFFAIWSVAAAHSASVSAGADLPSRYASGVLGTFGTFGIFVFFFFAGYFLALTEKTPGAFFRSKLTSIVVPTVFCGTLVWAYEVLRKGGITFGSWLCWILGVDTYLYFVTDLLIMYLVAYAFRKKNAVLIFGVVLSAAENIVLCAGNITFPHPYLDPLRFFWIFAGGMLIARYGLGTRLLALCEKLLPVTGILVLAGLLIPPYFGSGITYFTLWYLPFGAVASAFFFGLSAKLPERIRTLSAAIGKGSFAIYLLHMPFAGLAAWLGQKAETPVTVLLRPIAVLAVTWALIRLMRYLAEKLSLRSVFDCLTGMR